MTKVKAKEPGKKMFGAPLPIEQIVWIKQLAKVSKTSASEVLRQVIESARVYSPKEFEAKMMKAQMQRELEDATKKIESLTKVKEEIEAKLNA